MGYQIYGSSADGGADTPSDAAAESQQTCAAGDADARRPAGGESTSLLLPEPVELVTRDGAARGGGRPGRPDVAVEAGDVPAASGAAAAPMLPTLSASLALRVLACCAFSAMGAFPRVDGWRAHLTLCVFLFVMPGLMLLREVPSTVLVLFGLGVLAVSTAMPSPGADNSPWYGMARDVTWLCIFAVQMASSVTSSGLGRRLALTLMRWMGGSILGVAYAIAFTELVLAPVVPANTARAAILAPVVKMLIAPLPDAAQKQYIVLVAVHVNILTSALFLTGMSGNVLPVDAIELHFGMSYSWGDWLRDQCVPGGLSVVLLPLALKALLRPPPLDVGAGDPRQQAATDLQLLGKPSRDERATAAVLSALLILFATNDKEWGSGIATASACLAGVCALLAARVLTLDQMLVNKSAWMMLLFLGGVLSFIHSLQVEGVVDWFAVALENASSGLSGTGLVIFLGVLYYYSMYFFSMLNGHAAALLDPFVSVVVLAGAPQELAAAVFTSFTSLCASITHYSTGSVLIYFALG